MNAALRIEAANESFRRLECFPLACTLDEITFEMAVDTFATTERMCGWIESASAKCEPSKYFEPISNDELFQVIFGRHSSAEQREQAAILLHIRFVKENEKEIRQTVQFSEN